MNYLLIKPVLGTKDNCPIDSPNLYKPLADDVYATFDTGGINVDYTRKRDACSKAEGKQPWSVDATAQKTKCLGMCEVFDGTDRDHLIFDNGKCYVYDSDYKPTDISPSGVTLATDNTDLYSIITFGGKVIIADRAEHEPYMWYHGESNFVELIQSGTTYEFRYLLALANRIVGGYTNETNGDLDIRYTDALPTWASLDFDAANQFYNKSNEQMTGLARLGHNTGFAFTEYDINRIDYHSASTPVFSTYQVVANCGSTNHHSIASDGNYLYFFDRHRGFVRYDGNREIKIISGDIEEMMSGIGTSYDDLIVGANIPLTNEICWTVPLSDNTTPNYLLYYNTLTGQWRKEGKTARYIDYWKTYTDMTWTDLIAAVGGTGIWSDAGAHTWHYYTAEKSRMVFANTDGHTYMTSSEEDDGSDWDAYRIEPILPFPQGDNYHRLLEIWADIEYKTDVDLDFYWRGGDTVAEVENESWTSLGSINMNSPADPVLYCDQSARKHQVKWGTDAKAELYKVSGLKFGYQTQGKY